MLSDRRFVADLLAFVFDVKSRQEVLTLAGRGGVFESTAFSPDGNILGSLSYGGVLHLWRAAELRDSGRSAPATN